MIGVSVGYRAIQQSNSILPVRKIELSRRLADGSGWESTFVDITSEVVRLDRLSWKLDTDNLNEFKASNIRIEFDNSDRRWDEGSSNRFSGFLRYQSRIRIYLGLAVDGLEETFPVFSGVVVDVNEDSETPTVQVTIESLDALLRTTSAESAGIIVLDELLGIGDGVTAEFFTSKNAVGVIREIRVNGQPIRPGLRFTVSDLSVKTKPGKITFISTQPGPGEEVRADYIAWKTDQPIDDLVSDLMNQVPLVPVDLIEPVVFDPPVEREILHTLVSDFNQYELRQAKVMTEEPPPPEDGLITMDGFDSKTKWESGVRTNVNLTRVPNGISPQWTAYYEGDRLPEVEKLEIDGDATFQWVEDLNEAAGVSRSVANGILAVSMPTSFYRITNTKEEPGNGRVVTTRIKVTALSGFINIGTAEISTARGAHMSIISPTQVRIQTGGNTFGPFTVALSSFRTLRLVINTSALTWAFYVDGGLVSSGSYGSAPLGPSTGVYLDALATGQSNFELDFLRFNTREAGFPVGNWEKEIDYGVHLAGLTSFSLITTLGPFFADVQGNPTNARYFFRWRADGGSFTTEAEVSNGANLGSFTNTTFPRFIKFRVQVTGDENPVLTGVKRLFLPALATSNVIDGGSGVEDFTTWKGTFVPGDGSIGRFTAGVANSPSGFSFYQTLGPGDSIETDDFAEGQGSSVERIVLIALMATSGPNLPILRENLTTFTTRTILVSQAVLAGKTVLDVIKELARIADYEIGLKGDGSFFFRNKAAASLPDLELDDSNVEKVNDFSPGWERVFNRIRATHGIFVKEVDPESEGEPSPTSTDRFGDRFLSIGGGDLLFEEDVDLATVMAKRYFSRYKEPKRRLTAVARFLPEMELGDRVSVGINIPRQIAQTFDARVLGIAHDLMNFRTELELQEIA